ncbi:GEL complex subunit OPTI-like [Asterias amurensis]|uniref:GEL complex subunit OPTI-like n=1 Tax=Asterias amurensis TaxID=7602 RepID=UPI003AB7B667
MATKRRKGEQEDTKLSSTSAWKRAIVSGSKWQEKDEFLDVIYWGRQIVAILCGVIWGVIPLKGFLGIALFCAASAGILYVYFTSFQGVDEEDYGGVWELTKEGFMSSFALFLVIWIIVYSALFFD